MKKEPYFLSNKEWFYFDEQDFCYKLTDKAPEEAITSYQEFYNTGVRIDENQEIWVTC